MLHDFAVPAAQVFIWLELRDDRVQVPEGAAGLRAVHGVGLAEGGGRAGHGRIEVEHKSQSICA